MPRGSRLVRSQPLCLLPRLVKGEGGEGRWETVSSKFNAPSDQGGEGRSMPSIFFNIFYLYFCPAEE